MVAALQHATLPAINQQLGVNGGEGLPARARCLLPAPHTAPAAAAVGRGCLRCTASCTTMHALVRISLSRANGRLQTVLYKRQPAGALGRPRTHGAHAPGKARAQQLAACRLRARRCHGTQQRRNKSSLIPRERPQHMPNVHETKPSTGAHAQHTRHASVPASGSSYKSYNATPAAACPLAC